MKSSKKIERAITGPRTLRDPRSREYAIQTMRSLKRFLEAKRLDAKSIEDELEEIDRYKHWIVCGFETRDAYLQAEIGVTQKELRRRLAQDLAADPRVTALAPEKTAGPGRGKKTGANSTGFSKGSTHAAYLVRRLKRDFSEIAEALARGEFKSARAAAIAAGIIKPPTPFERILKLLPKLTAIDRRDLRTRLDEMET
jgi:hypothetical protein